MAARRRLLTLAVLAASIGAASTGAPAAGSVESSARTAGTPPPQGQAPRPLRLLRVRGTYDQPVYLTAAPGDRRRLFVVERPGRIRVIRDGHPVGAPFLNLSRLLTSTGEEQGLLSMAFAPDYARSGRFYVDYTARDNSIHVVEYRRATLERANPRTARLVLAIPKPENNHNGGLVVFGPDRLLYVGTGDGGGENDDHGAIGNAQSLGSLLGKILRIDPRPLGARRYRIPRGNPFAGQAGARPEIYDYGLRNPWRFSFDPLTGDLEIGDVGQEKQEEVDFAPRAHEAGLNFGWRVFEGFRRKQPDESVVGETPPVLGFGHDGSGACVVIGGLVVRDRSLSGYYGRYLYSDYCRGVIHSVVLGPGSATTDAPATSTELPGLVSFGRDALGHLYVVQQGGAIHRLA